MEPEKTPNSSPKPETPENAPKEELRKEEPTVVASELYRHHALSATKWAKFLAILGIIMAVLMAIAAFSIGGIMTFVMQMIPDSSTSSLATGGTIILTIVYLIIAVIYFIPCFYLLRFSSRTQTALRTTNQEKFIGGMDQLRRFFKYMGIIAIIYLILMVLGGIAVAIGGLIGASFT